LFLEPTPSPVELNVSENAELENPIHLETAPLTVWAPHGSKIQAPLYSLGVGTSTWRPWV